MKKSVLLICCLLLALVCFAPMAHGTGVDGVAVSTAPAGGAAAPAEEFLPAAFWRGALGSVIYFAFSLVMLAVGFKVVDWIVPGDIAAQLASSNVAAGVLVGLMMLGMCIIIAAAIH
jgi:putative membrane protein